MKRGLNVYPYCGSDPVNHADPTGEIANVLISGIEGGLIGLAAGFAGSAGSLLEQAISGERMNAGRGICALQDIFGGGLGIRKAYGYRYEMRDPDQPVRDGFDLGDFLRSTLTGGLMGGLSGVAFYGMDKAVGALKGSLNRGSKGGSDVIKNNLASKVKNIREQMPSTNLAKRGNMAVADVDVPGIKDNFVAHSKINDVLDKGFDIADFSYLKSENERIFTSYVNDQYPRYHDTEAKILEDIASQITDPNVSGKINLYSELPCCQSCSNIILEFRRMFPNIELNIFVE